MQQEPVDVWKVWEDNEAFHLLLASYAEDVYKRQVKE